MELVKIAFGLTSESGFRLKSNRLCNAMIGLKNSRHFLIQSEVKPKPIVTGSHAFSRASRQLHVFTLSFDWLIVFSVPFVTKRNKTLVLVFITIFDNVF